RSELTCDDIIPQLGLCRPRSHNPSVYKGQEHPPSLSLSLSLSISIPLSLFPPFSLIPSYSVYRFLFPSLLSLPLHFFLNQSPIPNLLFILRLSSCPNTHTHTDKHTDKHTHTHK